MRSKQVRWYCSLCLCVACVDTSAPSHNDNAGSDAGLAAWGAPVGVEKPPVAQAAAAGALGLPRPARVDAGQELQLPAAGSPASGARDSAAAGADAGPHAVGPVAAPPRSEPPVPTPSKRGELVISELMIDPKSSSDTAGEWFELYNPNEYELELRGCEIDDGAKSPHTLALGLRAKPHAYVTIARQHSPGFTPDATAPLSLTNSADSLALRCAGVELDRVSYDKAAGYPVTTGASLALDPARLDATQNDVADAWCTGSTSYGPELGTPGTANLPCVTADSDSDAGEASGD